MWTLRYVLLVGLAVVSIGCRTRTDSESDSTVDPLSGVEFDVSLPREAELANVWRPFVDEWEARTGAKVAFGDSGTGLQLIPIVDVPRLFAAGKLVTIKQDLVDAAGNGLWNDVLRGLRETVCVRPKKATAVIPLSCPILVCYYRVDLLEKAKLKPPQSWDDYQDLLETVNEWAPGLTVVEPWSEEFRATMFLARAISYARFPGNYSLCFDIHSGKPLIGEAGFVRALEDSAKAIAGMPTDVLQFSPLDCSARVRTGEAALAIGFEVPTESKSVRDHDAVIGFVGLPGREVVFDRSVGEWSSTPDGNLNRPTLTAFTGYCVGFSPDMNESQQRAAVNLIAAMAGEDSIAVTLPGDLRSLCRLSQERSGDQWYGENLIGDEARLYSQTVVDSLRSTALAAELPLIGRDRFRSTLTDTITRVINGDVSARDSLKLLVSEWAGILDQIGTRKAHNSYRASFGLSARK
jgi:multiple sugar transport system substrate-binding protein